MKYKKSFVARKKRRRTPFSVSAKKTIRGMSKSGIVHIAKKASASEIRKSLMITQKDRRIAHGIVNTLINKKLIKLGRTVIDQT